MQTANPVVRFGAYRSPSRRHSVYTVITIAGDLISESLSSVRHSSSHSITGIGTRSQTASEDASRDRVSSPVPTSFYPPPTPFHHTDSALLSDFVLCCCFLSKLHKRTCRILQVARRRYYAGEV